MNNVWDALVAGVNCGAVFKQMGKDRLRFLEGNNR